MPEFGRRSILEFCILQLGGSQAGGEKRSSNLWQLGEESIAGWAGAWRLSRRDWN
jgi:hypothetical protein